MTRSPNLHGISMNIQMMMPEKKRSATDGFTLLELLLAVFIFSVIATIVYGAFQSSFKTVSSTDETASLDSQARLIFERIESDIMSIYLQEKDCFKGETGSVNGNRADTLEFCSIAEVRLNREIVPSKVKILDYSVEENEATGLLDMYRHEKEYVDGETSETESDEASSGIRIGRNIHEFRVDYLNGDGEEVESWERTKGEEQQRDGAFSAPKVVKILVSFRSEDGEYSYSYRSSFAVW